MLSFVYLKVLSMNFISFAMNSAQSVSLEANFLASVFTVMSPELHFRLTRYLNWQHGHVSTVAHLFTITSLVLSAGFAELQHDNALDPWIPVQRIKITMYTLYFQTSIHSHYPIKHLKGFVSPMLILATVEKSGENMDLPHDKIEGKLSDTARQSPSKVLHVFSAVYKGQRSKVKQLGGTRWLEG